jgi:hypothetical protein
MLGGKLGRFVGGILIAFFLTAGSAAAIPCVPYARDITGVSLHGNAWTWWHRASGLYARGLRPKVGAILVFRKTTRLRFGHVAVVSEVINRRLIRVDQANWHTRGRIEHNVLVRDVSPRNDWHEVRVWYRPAHSMGKAAYATYGFIYPRRPPHRSMRAGLRHRRPVFRG